MLHKTNGLNPRMTYCPRCGGEGQSLILLGVHEYKGKCATHGVVYGARLSCPAKGCMQGLSDSRMIGEHERLPDSEPCNTCRDEITQHADIVAAGGVYFKCDECHKTGVIKKSPLADIVREHSNNPTPAPCGIQFGACSEHAPGAPQ